MLPPFSPQNVQCDFAPHQQPREVSTTSAGTTSSRERRALERARSNRRSRASESRPRPRPTRAAARRRAAPRCAPSITPGGGVDVAAVREQPADERHDELVRFAGDDEVDPREGAARGHPHARLAVRAADQGDDLRDRARGWRGAAPATRCAAERSTCSRRSAAVCATMASASSAVNRTASSRIAKKERLRVNRVVREATLGDVVRARLQVFLVDRAHLRERRGGEAPLADETATSSS